MAKEANTISLKKQAAEYFDWSTFLVTIMLVTMGLISIYSATYEAGTSYYFFKQLFFAGIGLIGMLIIAFLPEKWISNSTIVLFVISLLLLISVLIFGKTVSGTKGWFNIAGNSFQPAELAKMATLMMLAFFLSYKGIEIDNLRDLLISCLIVLAPIVLIMVQPDVGTATVIAVMLLGILMWVGYDLYFLYLLFTFPFILIMSLMGTPAFVMVVSFFSLISVIFKRAIWITLIGVGLMIAVGYYSHSLFKLFPSNSRDRIETFLYPKKDPLKKGYNVMQSVMAVGSGGITGKGFLKGSQTQLRYIPEQRTDFIFCVPAEEFGFLGGTFVICLYGVLVLRAVRTAFDSSSKYFSVISIGVATVFFYHFIINLGMVIRVVPVMGIPLPFMSYGGTALLINMAMTGLILNAYRSNKIKDR